MLSKTIAAIRGGNRPRLPIYWNALAFGLGLVLLTFSFLSAFQSNSTTVMEMLGRGVPENQVGAVKDLLGQELPESQVSAIKDLLGDAHAEKRMDAILEAGEDQTAALQTFGALVLGGIIGFISGLLVARTKPNRNGNGKPQPDAPPQ